MFFEFCTTVGWHSTYWIKRSCWPLDFLLPISLRNALKWSRCLNVLSKEIRIERNVEWGCSFHLFFNTKNTSDISQRTIFNGRGTLDLLPSHTTLTGLICKSMSDSIFSFFIISIMIIVNYNYNVQMLREFVCFSLIRIY